MTQDQAIKRSKWSKIAMQLYDGGTVPIVNQIGDDIDSPAPAATEASVLNNQDNQTEELMMTDVLQQPSAKIPFQNDISTATNASAEVQKNISSPEKIVEELKAKQDIIQQRLEAAFDRFLQEAKPNNKLNKPYKFTPQTTIDGLNVEISNLFEWMTELNRKIDFLIDASANGNKIKLDRQTLIKLRESSTAKLIPRALHNQEIFTYKSPNYSCCLNLEDTQMPQYSKLRDSSNFFLV